MRVSGSGLPRHHHYPPLSARVRWALRGARRGTQGPDGGGATPRPATRLPGKLPTGPLSAAAGEGRKDGRTLSISTGRTPDPDEPKTTLR